MINRFRVWDKDEGKYVKDASSSILSIGNTDDGDFRLSSLCPGRYIVEQDTGLEDKNGKRIKEGDIVKYKFYADSRLDYVDEVFYSTISGAFMVGDEDNIRTLDCLVNVEVIGNIHENKDLLGGEE